MRLHDALNDLAVKKAKVTGKPYKLADGRGMYLMVTAKGAKSWRLDYRFNGKQKTLTLGLYPDVSLAKARAKTQEARELIADGIDPAQIRQSVKRNHHQVDAVSKTLPKIIRLLRGCADNLDVLLKEANHGIE